VAALKLSEKSPLPPALAAKDIPGGRTQVLNVCQIKRIDDHAYENDQDSAIASILDIENWLHWNGELDNPTRSEED